jgi:organic hydroperoxide reductase OsmC/OhrA
MSRTATYHTDVSWKVEHWGHIVMGNGPEMDFSAPPDAQGHPGVLTPEDAFVAAANTCIMMMFLWAAERYKTDLPNIPATPKASNRSVDRTEASPAPVAKIALRRAAKTGKLSAHPQSTGGGAKQPVATR